MSLKDDILLLAQKKKKLKSSDVVKKYKVSRQYASSLISELLRENKLVKFGSTHSAFYVLPENKEAVSTSFRKRLTNINLKEHEVFHQIEKQTTLVSLLDDNVHSIFFYAFSEMLNNAIEHSQSKNIDVSVQNFDKKLIFDVNDFGIGVFRNIMKKRKLQSELEAIQDLLKGKTTTQPKAHSGEGIFFTSKIADVFSLESYKYKLTIDNIIEDVFVEELKPSKRGTRVHFTIDMKSNKHLNDVFKRYQTDSTELAFDKTEIQIKLYTLGTIHISRSQARRVLSGLDKFNYIIFDFDKVPTVGQAFADEIFRVFKNRYPHIKLKPINMNETVEFMVKRSQKKDA